MDWYNRPIQKSDLERDWYNRLIQKSDLEMDWYNRPIQESDHETDRLNRPIQKSEVKIYQLCRPIQSEDRIGSGRSNNRIFLPLLDRTKLHSMEPPCKDSMRHGSISKQWIYLKDGTVGFCKDSPLEGSQYKIDLLILIWPNTKKNKKWQILTNFDVFLKSIYSSKVGSGSRSVIGYFQSSGSGSVMNNFGSVP